MAFNTYAQTTINTNREDGSTRTLQVTLERDAAAPGSVKVLPIVGELVTIEGAQDQALERFVAIKQLQFKLNADKVEQDFIFGLLNADRREYRVTVTDTTTGFIYFTGYFEPQLGRTGLYEARQILPCVFVDGFAYLATQDIDEPSFITLDEVADEIIAGLGYDLDKRFQFNFKPAQLAVTDILPERIRAVSGGTTISTPIGLAGYSPDDEPLSKFALLAGAARLFGARWSIYDGSLQFTELHEQATNPTAVNEYADTGAGYSQGTVDYEIEVSENTAIETPAAEQSVKIPGRRFVHQFRYINRQPFIDITENSGGQATSGNTVETYTEGSFVATGDIVRSAGIDYDVNINSAGEFIALLNVARVRVKNNLGDDLYYDFLNGEWSDTAVEAQVNITTLNSGPQTFQENIAAFNAPPLPDGVFGEVVFELLYDIANLFSGSSSELISLEVTDMFIDSVQADLDDTEIYQRWEANTGLEDGRTVAQLSFVGTLDGTLDDSLAVEYLDGSAWQFTGNWTDADGDDILEVVLARRAGQVLNGSRSKYSARIRDITPIGMQTIFNVTGPDAGQVTALGVYIRHELRAGYYDIRAINANLLSQTEASDYAQTTIQTNDGAAGTPTDSQTSTPGGGGGGGSIAIGWSSITDFVNENVDRIQFTKRVDFTQEVNIAGALDVDGATTLDEVTIADTLNVGTIANGGAAIAINEALNISGGVDIDGTLVTSGDVTINAALEAYFLTIDNITLDGSSIDTTTGTLQLLSATDQIVLIDAGLRVAKGNRQNFSGEIATVYYNDGADRRVGLQTYNDGGVRGYVEVFDGSLPDDQRVELGIDDAPVVTVDRQGVDMADSLSVTGSITATGSISANGSLLSGNDVVIEDSTPGIQFLETDTTDLNIYLVLASSNLQFQVRNDAFSFVENALEIKIGSKLIELEYDTDINGAVNVNGGVEINSSLDVAGAVDVSGPTTFRQNVTINKGVGANGDAVLNIEADTDNSVETSNPIINLIQDGGAINARLRMEGEAGTITTGTTQNALILQNLGANDVQIITNDTVRISAVADGVELFGNVDITGPLTISGDFETDGVLIADQLRSSGFADSYLDFTGLNSAFGANRATLGSVTGINMVLDTSANGTDDFFRVYSNGNSSAAATLLFEIGDGGDTDIFGTLDVNGDVSGTTFNVSGNINVDPDSSSFRYIDVLRGVGTDKAGVRLIAGEAQGGFISGRIDGATVSQIQLFDGQINLENNTTITGSLDVTGDLDVDGATSLDFTVIDGQAVLNSGDFSGAIRDRVGTTQNVVIGYRNDTSDTYYAGFDVDTGDFGIRNGVGGMSTAVITLNADTGDISADGTLDVGGSISGDKLTLLNDSEAIRLRALNASGNPLISSYDSDDTTRRGFIQWNNAGILRLGNEGGGNTRVEISGSGIFEVQSNADISGDLVVNGNTRIEASGQANFYLNDTATTPDNLRIIADFVGFGGAVIFRVNEQTGTDFKYDGRWTFESDLELNGDLYMDADVVIDNNRNAFLNDADIETAEIQTLRTTLFKPETISGLGGEMVFNALSSVVSVNTGADTIVVENAVFSSGDAVIVSSAAYGAGGFSNVELNITSAGSAVSGGTEYSYTVNSGSDTDIAPGDTAIKADGTLILVDATEGGRAPLIRGYSGITGFGDSPLSGGSGNSYNFSLENDRLVFQDSTAIRFIAGNIDGEYGVSGTEYGLAVGDPQGNRIILTPSTVDLFLDTFTLRAFTGGEGIQIDSENKRFIAGDYNTQLGPDEQTWEGFFAGIYGGVPTLYVGDFNSGVLESGIVYDNGLELKGTNWLITETQWVHPSLGGAIFADVRTAATGSGASADAPTFTDIWESETTSNEDADTLNDRIIKRVKYVKRFGKDKIRLNGNGNYQFQAIGGWGGTTDASVILSIDGESLDNNATLNELASPFPFSVTLDISSLTDDEEYTILITLRAEADGQPANGPGTQGIVTAELREDLYLFDIVD